jgi:hypothetical protein
MLIRIILAPFFSLYRLILFLLKILIHLIKVIEHFLIKLSLRIFIPLKTVFYLSDDIVTLPLIFIGKILKPLGINWDFKKKARLTRKIRSD